MRNDTRNEPLLPPGGDSDYDYASSLRRESSVGNDMSTPPRQASSPRSASWTAPGRLAARESPRRGLGLPHRWRPGNGDDRSGIALTCSCDSCAYSGAGSFRAGIHAIGGAMLFMEKDHTGFWPAPVNSSTLSPSPVSLDWLWHSGPSKAGLCTLNSEQQNQL